MSGLWSLHMMEAHVRSFIVIPAEIHFIISAGQPYHRQRGQFGSLTEALRYIDGHEKWAVSKKKGPPCYL